MKLNKQLKSSNSSGIWNIAKLLSLVLAISLITLFSCQEDSSIELEEQTMTVTESEISPEMQALINKEITDLRILSGDVIGPIAAGCRAGVRSVDLAGTPSVADVPFYESTILNELIRADGRCGAPGSIQPCLFRGSIIVNHETNVPGNYRIYFGSTRRDLNGVRNSFSFFYPNDQLSLAVYCGLSSSIVIQAENPTVPGDWITVFGVSFDCSRCNLVPVD